MCLMLCAHRNGEVMNNDCKLIIKEFKFLEDAGFKCTVTIPDGFVNVEYEYQNLKLDANTDYRNELPFPYFYMTLSTGKAIGTTCFKDKKISISDSINIVKTDIGTSTEKEKLAVVENTMENFDRVVEIYAEFVREHLGEIIGLAK